jgi:drug/metabolite transporter (DMT)-like permease
MFGKIKYHLLLHAIIFLWGFTGILGKLIKLDSMVIVWWRLLIAFIALFVFLKFSKWKLAIHSKKQLWGIIGVGVLVGMHWVTFFLSIQMSTASLGILCLSTTTIHVAWLEPIIMKRRFLKTEFLFGLMIICALIYVSGDFNAKDYAALFIGLSSAVFAALFSVFNARLVQKTPSSTISLVEFGVAFVFISVLLAFQGKMDSSLFTMTTSDLLWLLFLGVVCTSFAFLVVVDIVKRLGAFTVSLSINLEPIYTIILAIYILGENELLTDKFYIGAAVIVLVVAVNALVKYYMKAKNKRAFERD